MLTSRILKSYSYLRLPLLLAICAAVIVAALLTFPTSSRAKLQVSQQPATRKKQRVQKFVPGEVLVRYRDEGFAKSKGGISSVVTRDGGAMQMRIEDFGVSGTIPGLRIAHVAPEATLEAVAALRRQPDVLYAEPNYILRADVLPNDPRFAGSQANLTKIGAPTAWDTQKGSSGIVVAVLDEGIDINHQDLQANIWTNPMPGSISGITGDLHGFNFVDNNGTIFSGADTESHATHVAGIAGAVGNNGLGVAGVNWTVNLMSLKFLDEQGSGDTDTAIKACDYAKKMRDLWESSGHTRGANIRVINASFGGGAFAQAFLDAINALNTSGVLFVAAAGNIDNGTREPNNDLVPHYPSSFNAPNIVAVAATDSSDALSSFSHFGATAVDLGAPGSSILSTTPHCSNPADPDSPCLPDFTDANGDTYSFFSGTSMSTPHVSGSAALLWAQNPNLSVQQVKNLLLLGGDVVPAMIDKTLTGRRLNVGGSMQSLLENDSTAPGAVTNFHINSQVGRTLNLGWTASGDDGATGNAALYQISFTDGTSGTVFPLKGVIPITSGAGQITDVTIPYRHTGGTITLREFDNAGNEGTPQTLAVGIPLSSGDPYTVATGGTVGLTTGGNIVNINMDDAYVDFALPFFFPFFNDGFSELIISSNGALYFSDPPRRCLTIAPCPDTNADADDVPSSPGTLGGYKMIAGLWDDLDLRTSVRADAGVFVVQPNATTIIFRWQGKPCNFDGNVCAGGADVNFEIELGADGTIKTRYGSGNTNLNPVVGLGGGNQDGYVVASHTSEESKISLTNAAEVTFTRRPQTVSTVQFSQATFAITESTASLNVNVTRSGDTSSFATVSYATTDSAGTNLCSTANGQASSRCDYLVSNGTLSFAMGENQKVISIPIVDDVLVEGAENFSISLSNAVGATLGAQTNATLTINDNDSSTGANPIDTTAVFVRQHYVDLLNREPDALGLAFWIGTIDGCTPKPGCTDVFRINASAAFFLSIEFKETGYLVYRIYKSAFNNLPGAPIPVTFQDFLRDTQRIGQGVVVGQGAWEALLESNKQTFTAAFVQRADFKAAYPDSMTAAQFVDKLNTNAGGALSPSERDAAIAMLGQTPSDLSRRAQVIRFVAEDVDLFNAEVRKAFVLMQYFGYLRRNPNDPSGLDGQSDPNFNGFNFWLTKLNQFNGDAVAAEMVKAFIDSIEYRRRYAP